ncbi:MAG: hypothetical protein ACKO96_49220, partial [Flammeovirgaceae bacterium]
MMPEERLQPMQRALLRREDWPKEQYRRAHGKRTTQRQGQCGTTQRITLPEGSKTLKASIDWCSSPEFNVSDIRTGKIVVKNAF